VKSAAFRASFLARSGRLLEMWFVVHQMMVLAATERTRGGWS
jgi:hypothetical protein